MKHYCLFLWVFLGFSFFCTPLWSQDDKKYNALLWEISGNGLEHASYLYGTMHISKKLAFNLGDSFYNALRQADIVALELDPGIWQAEDYRINQEMTDLKVYYSGYDTDYLNELTFLEQSPIPLLVAALRTEPENVNSFLYRSEFGEEDFQEDTYLDLFIYQSGKKLGKYIFPLEDYIRSQIMVMEGYKMEMDKKRDNYNGNLSYTEAYEINEKMVGAYRRGDLNLLDSLYRLTISSSDFYDKVIVNRNRIQADGMDSLMKSGKRIFTGVGAAHLPGKQGVIEMLRSKGYTVRPVPTLQRDREGQKNVQDIIAPVSVITQYNEDSLFSFSAPGILLPEEFNGNRDRVHYADMANGAYFLVTRIRTLSLTEGFNIQDKIRILDSIIYENIPGRITARTEIRDKAYPGVAISNILKSGKKERYHIYTTPYEWLVFKVSGNGDYAYSEIADSFFASINFEYRQSEVLFQPSSGGFEMKFPSRPVTFFTKTGTDGLPEWKYAVQDPKQERAYFVLHKNIYSFDHIEADSIADFLMTYSLSQNEQIKKKVSSGVLEIDQRQVYEHVFELKSGQYLFIRNFISGPHYYMVAVRAKENNLVQDTYFNSFRISPFRYQEAHPFTDSNLNIQAIIPFSVSRDSNVCRLYDLYESMNGMYADLQDSLLYVNSRSANFISYETGEVITLSKVMMGKYYMIPDSVEWMNSILDTDSQWALIDKDITLFPDRTARYTYLFGDSSSNRVIKKSWFFSGNEAILINTSFDRLIGESPLVSSIFASISFLRSPAEVNIFEDKLDVLLEDIHSEDTTRTKAAQEGLINYPVYNGNLDQVRKILALMQEDTVVDQDTRERLIMQLGRMCDSAGVIKDYIADHLKRMYESAVDKVSFQSVILTALSQLNTAKATQYFKQLLLEDPIIYDESEGLSGLFSGFYDDSFVHQALLFPDLLILANTEDYKLPVYELLSTYWKNKKINKDAFSAQVPDILFETNIAYKRARYSFMNQNTESWNDGILEYFDMDPFYILDYIERGPVSNYGQFDLLESGLVLLAPFYHEDASVKKLFDKIFSANQVALKLMAAESLLDNDILIPDSILQYTLHDSTYRLTAYGYFRIQEHPGMSGKFQWKNAEQYAGALMKQFYPEVFSSELLSKLPVAGEDSAVIIMYRLKNRNKNDPYYLGLCIKQDAMGYYQINRMKSTIVKEDPQQGKSEKEWIEDIRNRIYIQEQPSGKNYFAKNRYNL